MLRIAFLGTKGRYSSGVLQAVAAEHEVVLVGLAEKKRSLTAKSLVGTGLRRLGWFTHASASNQVPNAAVLPVESGGDARLVETLRTLRPDLICMAGFPWLLPQTIYTLPSLGAINVHGSLLPRHRGAMPLFWIYYHDDRESGVTVHKVAEAADTGDILVQERFPVPRGFPVDCLNQDNTRAAATAIKQALRILESGQEVSCAQDETLVTAAPRIRQGERYADLENWGAERVWHFLAGLQARYREPLFENGHALTYKGVEGFGISPHAYRPGSVKVNRHSLVLYCRDGVVELRR